MAENVETAPSEHRIRQSVLDEIKTGNNKKATGTEPTRLDTMGAEIAIAVGTDNPSSKAVILNRVNIVEDSRDEFIIQGIASAGLDSQTMRVLEARVYDLIKEVLDVDNMNVLRRNFVSLLRQSVRLFFSTTLKHWASAQAKVSVLMFAIPLVYLFMHMKQESVSDANLTWLLDYLIQTVWPGGTLLKANPVMMDEKDGAAELLKLRKSNIAELLSLLPAGLLSNSLGDGQVINSSYIIFADLIYLLNFDIRSTKLLINCSI